IPRRACALRIIVASSAVIPTPTTASRSSSSRTSRTCDAIPRRIKIVTYPVPGRIRVPDRIIQPIAISIQSLRVGNHWNDRVRLDELSDGWIVPPGAIVIQPAQALLPLPGVAVIRRRRAPGEAGLAKGSISQLPHPAAGGIRHDARRAQVVAEEIEHAVVPRHRIALDTHGPSTSAFGLRSGEARRLGGRQGESRSIPPFTRDSSMLAHCMGAFRQRGLPDTVPLFL